MSFSLEPQVLRDWLSPFGLTLDTLTELPYPLQAEVLVFLLPEEEDSEPDEISRMGLSLLGWAVGTKALGQESGKRLLRVLFRLFLLLKEPDPAAYIFYNIWPEPEPARVTYFSELIQLLLAQGTLEGARQALVEMQELYRGRYTTFITEAEICLHRRDFEAARLAYLKGLETTPNSRRLSLNLARVAYKQNQFEEAASILDQVEQDYDEAKVLPLKAARLWEKLGNTSKAARITGEYALYRQRKQAELCQKILAISLPDQAAGSSESRLDGPALELPESNRADQASSPQSTRAKKTADLALVPELARPEQALPEAVYQVLSDIFGHEEFRPGQEQVIANILAGHIIILSIVCMIFIFGAMSPVAGWGFSPVSVAFSIFMFCLELLVGAIQAFIFTNLTAVFIGQSIEEHHHDEHEHVAVSESVSAKH